MTVVAGTIVTTGGRGGVARQSAPYRSGNQCGSRHVSSRGIDPVRGFETKKTTEGGGVKDLSLKILYQGPLLSGQ